MPQPPQSTNAGAQLLQQSMMIVIDRHAGAAAAADAAHDVGRDDDLI
jgi:hypothetical protein